MEHKRSLEHLIPTVKITQKSLATLPYAPEGKARVTHHDSELHGFALVVGKTARTFVLKRWVDGRKRKITIGRAWALSAAMAGSGPGRSRAVAPSNFSGRLQESLRWGHCRFPGWIKSAE